MNELGREIRDEFRQNLHVCRKLVPLLQILSHKTRFRIVCTLARGDFCVADLAEIIEEPSLSSLSQHLKILRLAGLVSSRRSEQNRIYHLIDEDVGKLIAYLRDTYLGAQQSR